MNMDAISILVFVHLPVSEWGYNSLIKRQISYGLIVCDPSLSGPLKCMQFGIISVAMLACLVHMVGTELEMILNVSLPHLLCLMIHQVFGFSFPLFLLTLRKNTDKACLSFLQTCQS